MASEQYFTTPSGERSTQLLYMANMVNGSLTPGASQPWCVFCSVQPTCGAHGPDLPWCVATARPHPRWCCTRAPGSTVTGNSSLGPTCPSRTSWTLSCCRWADTLLPPSPTRLRLHVYKSTNRFDFVFSIGHFNSNKIISYLFC